MTTKRFSKLSGPGKYRISLFTFLIRETNFLNNFQKFKNSFPILRTDFVKKNEETIQSRGNYSREDTN